jgi:ribose-phosphate pyrophosphokinase
VHEVAVRRFPDGESLVRITSRARDAHAILFRSLDHPNERLVEAVLASETLRKRGARSVTLVAPYLGYMRQDKEFRAGEAVSQRIVGDLLGRYFDRVLTVDAHLHRTRELSSVLTVPCRNLSAAALLARGVRAAGATLVVGPDRESAQWARAVAAEADVPFLVGSKIRTGDRAVAVSVRRADPVRGAVVALVDDIVSTGHTIVEAARALRPHRPRRLLLFAVHALFDEDAARRIRAAGIESVRATNTVHHPAGRIDVAPVIARALDDGA